MFLLADSAIIGHLGTTQLAGHGVASAALVTAANIFVFLAYGTTSIVARQIGAGSERTAVTAGIAGVWLAVGLGLVTAVVVASTPLKARARAKFILRLAPGQDPAAAMERVRELLSLS